MVSLAQARWKAAELRAKLKRREEIHPSTPAPRPATPTFGEAARACHEAIKSG
jgi:hypothetical protein